MSRFFKTLKPYWKSVLLIIALLVLQAYADLSLPQYTSDIIDTGIQNGGVSHCMPQAVTKEEFELAKVFMTEDEVAIWEDSYREDGDVYRLDVTDEKKLDEYDDTLAMSLIINNQMSSVTAAQFKEQMAAQEQKLEELTLKIEDVETLLDDVSDAAYDKAVEVVTDTVRQETHKEDIRLVEESKKWVLSPERKAPKKERDYAAARLDGVITKIKRVMQNALAKIQKTLMQPEVKKAGKEQIKEKARESIREKLAKGRLNADRDNRERWEREGRIAPKKKHDMEL